MQHGDRAVLQELLSHSEMAETDNITSDNDDNT